MITDIYTPFGKESKVTSTFTNTGQKKSESVAKLKIYYIVRFWSLFLSHRLEMNERIDSIQPECEGKTRVSDGMFFEIQLVFDTTKVLICLKVM